MEKQRRSRRPKPAVIYCRYDEDDARIVGLGTIASAPVNRLWGEALNSLTARARTAAQQREPMIAAYPTPVPETAPVAAPGEPVPAPPPAPTFDRHAPDAAKRWHAFAEGIEQ